MKSKENADAVDLMEQDHRAILARFEAYRALVTNRGSTLSRKTLADDICMEITIHMRLEDEMLYPIADDAGRASSRARSGGPAQPTTREQIAKVLGMQPDQPGYDACVLALGLSIHQQVQQEHRHLFPAVRMSGVDLRELAGRVRERRIELQTVSDALREEALLAA